MGIPLYEVTVRRYIQTVGSIEGVLKKGLDYCGSAGIDPNDLLESRLHPDMLPLRFQLYSVVNHSVRAIECVKSGLFTRPPETPQIDYAGFQGLLADASAKLAAYQPAEIDALEGRDLIFQMGEHKTEFTAEGFLLSFALPNFYFHATTAYDILRMKGVPLGKRDYLGRPQSKG